MFVLTRSFLSIRFGRKVYPLYKAVFGVQHSEFTYHPSPGMTITARCIATEMARTPSKPRINCGGVFKVTTKVEDHQLIDSHIYMYFLTFHNPPPYAECQGTVTAISKCADFQQHTPCCIKLDDKVTLRKNKCS